MKHYINKLFFWLNCARVYSLPITVLNWLVIFIYSLKSGGNWLFGLIALVGIGFVHMSTNLIDDYFDYKILIQDKNFMTSAQNCKCLYLKNGSTTVEELKKTIIIFLLIAGLIGTILFFTTNYYVAIYAILGLIVALSYQKLSLNGLGEIAVIFAFGPLLYEGVYCVMTNKFSFEVLILSIICAFFTNTILYVHMLMDFDGDECSHKTTLCRKFKTKQNALDFLLFFYLVSFILIGYLSVKSQWYLITLLTIPLIIDLYISMKKYNNDKTNLPKIKFYHYPLDNWEKIKSTCDAPFYFRFFYSRNIVTMFMLLLCVAICLSK